MRIAGFIYGTGRPPFEGSLTIDQGRIVALEEGVSRAPDLVDLRPARLVPGFIDLHIHGGGGWDVESTEGFARFLASQGTTAYYGSLPVAPVETFEQSIRSLAADCREPRPQGGARLLGIHLEGPFLNVRKRGVMAPQWILAPDAELLERWLELGRGHVRQVTIAPEVPGALELIRTLAMKDITVCGGHTDSTAEETAAGIDAGVTGATHLFNAMRAFDHRSPGPMAAYMADPRVTCELICDCLHVHPTAMRLAISAKGFDRICVISDAGPFSCLPPGPYDLGGVWHVIVHPDGTCRIPEGNLASSTFHQVAGVGNLVQRLGYSLNEAVHMAATVPARVAGVAGRKGRLAVGYDADIVALDEEFRVVQTLVEGEIAYRHDETASRINPARRPTA